MAAANALQPLFYKDYEMNELVERFGKKMTDLIESGHPAAARRILGLIFRAYGKAVQYAPKSKDSAARRYLMSFAGDRMAASIAGEGRAVIVSLFTPCEVFEAMGIPVMIPEGLGCYMTASGCERVFLHKAEECGIPETLCSYHKLLIGMTEAGVLPRPRMIVNTTLACDANQLSFRYLAEYFHVPHMVLDVPNEYNEDTKEYMVRQLQEMTDFAEKNTGKKLLEERFTEVMRRASRSVENYRRILTLKSERQESSRITFAMMDVLAMHIMLGTKETLRYTEMLIRDLEKLPKKIRVPRVLWVHTLPYWQPSVNEPFLYNARAEVICCDMNYDNLSDLSVEHPYESLADQLLLNAHNGPAKRRIDRTLYYAKQMHADGVIWFCHWGCKQTMGPSVMAARILTEAGFPTLLLDGDGCDTRNVQEGQTATRIGAFLEQLEGTR